MSLVWISFSYAGWNAVIYLGGEVRNPERNLPHSLLTGTLIVTAIYRAINSAFVLAVRALKYFFFRRNPKAAGGSWTSLTTFEASPAWTLTDSPT